MIKLKYQHKYIKQENEKINSFKFILKKYMPAKEFIVRPSGLHIFDENKQEISVSCLSAGETKLIFLFFTAIFFKDLMLIIDDPEASLPITWQETLLPDLLAYTNVEKIVMATKSPYILKDESVKEFEQMLD